MTLGMIPRTQEVRKRTSSKRPSPKLRHQTNERNHELPCSRGKEVERSLLDEQSYLQSPLLENCKPTLFHVQIHHGDLSPVLNPICPLGHLNNHVNQVTLAAGLVRYCCCKLHRCTITFRRPRHHHPATAELSLCLALWYRQPSPVPYDERWADIASPVCQLRPSMSTHSNTFVVQLGTIRDPLVKLFRWLICFVDIFADLALHVSTFVID